MGKKKKKTNETPEQKAAHKGAQKLMESMSCWADQTEKFIKKQDEVIDYLGGILLGYEERLRREKELYVANKLSSHMIDEDPDGKWMDTYLSVRLFDSKIHDHSTKYKELLKWFDEVLENKNLSETDKDALTAKRNELCALRKKMDEQDLFAGEYSCHLRLNSMIESLYRINTQAREALQSVGREIDEAKKQNDALKNRLSRFSAEKAGKSAGNSVQDLPETRSRLREGIDEQIRLNQQAILRLDQEISERAANRDWYSNRFTTFSSDAQMEKIRTAKGEDCPAFKKLKGKEVEFNKQNTDLRNNITALIRAKAELITINQELLAQKAALCEEEKRGGEKKKEVVPPQKETTPSKSAQNSGKPQIINLFGGRQNSKKAKLHLSYFGTAKDKPELLLHPKHPTKKQLFLPVQKKLSVKSNVKKEKTLRLPLYPKKNSDVFLLRKKLPLETIQEESSDWNQQKQRLTSFLRKNPGVKLVAPKPSSGVLLKERAKSQN